MYNQEAASRLRKRLLVSNNWGTRREHGREDLAGTRREEYFLLARIFVLSRRSFSFETQQQDHCDVGGNTGVHGSRASRGSPVQ